MSDLFGEEVEINHQVRQKKTTIKIIPGFLAKSNKTLDSQNKFEKLHNLQLPNIENNSKNNNLAENLAETIETFSTKNELKTNPKKYSQESESQALSRASTEIENSLEEGLIKKNQGENYFGKLENFGIVNITSQFDPSKKSKELVEQINWATTQRKTELVSEIINLSKHSSVAVRRKAAESLVIIGNKDTILAIQTWENSESDRQTLLTLRCAIEKLERTDKFGQNKNILTVSEALKMVKTLIGKDIYQVEGEISELKDYGTMVYFGLKENQENRIDCSSYISKINELDFVLTEGLSVRITGRFKISKYAKLTVEIIKIELTGDGAILQNLKKLEEKLTLEGFFDESRKRKIPKFPTRILLIASGNSAAMGDFVKVLGNRRSGMTIFHQNIKSQGVGAEFEILEELARTNDLIDRFEIDTVVITRGGGSSDDLFVFNSEKIVRYLHGIKKPIIVAIGHERDVSLTEKAADLRASTPSNAAELVSHSNLQIEHFLEQFEIFGQSFLEEKASLYKSFVGRVCDFGLKLIQSEIGNCREITQKTDGLIFQIISNIKENLNQNQLYYNQISSQILQKKQQVNSLYQNIFAQIQQNVVKTQNQLTLLDSQLEIENPSKILAKGYAIIKQNNQILTKVNQIDRAQKMEITMSDGVLELSHQKN